MAVKPRKQPMRTCVACKASRPKKELIRIVRSPEGKVFVDPSGKANGRGAYICPEEACLQLAICKGRLASALEINIDKETLQGLKEDFKALAEKERAGASADLRK